MLPYGQNYLDLSVSNTYLNPQVNIENQYAINDGPWISIEDIGNLRLLKIPRGKNTLRFRAKHSGGDWLPEKSFALYAPKWIYQRWWFILLSSVIFISTIYLFSLWRNRVIANRNKILQDKVNRQTEALNNEKSQLAHSLKMQKELTHELNLTQESKNSRSYTCSFCCNIWYQR